MGIVDDLLAHPGHYVGIDTVVGTELRGAASIVVTPLPGRAGVTLDYEIYNSTTEPILGHAERTLIGRRQGGGAVMVIGHTHGDSLAVLHEGDPGVFELADESPYPMKVVVSMPEPGRLRHAWYYGAPGDELEERDVAEVQLLA